jgi:hypothetical protein
MGLAELTEAQGDGISVLVWNIQGGLLRKLAEEQYSEFVFAFDVVILLETHLDELDELDEIEELNDFAVYRADRAKAKRASGGVALLLRKRAVATFGL